MFSLAEIEKKSTSRCVCTVPLNTGVEQMHFQLCRDGLTVFTENSF